MEAKMASGSSNASGAQRRKELKEELGTSRDEIHAMRSGFRGEFGGVHQFLADNLSDDDKDDIKALIADNHDATKEKIKAFVADYESGDSIADFVEELADDKQALFDELEEYIEEDMSEEYEAFVEEFLETFIDAKTKRLENHLLRKSAWEERREARVYALSDKFHKQLATIIAKVSPDALDAFMERAETAVEKKLEQIEDNAKLSDAAKEKLTDLLNDLLDSLDESADEIETLEDDSTEEVLDIDTQE